MSSPQITSFLLSTYLLLSSLDGVSAQIPQQIVPTTSSSQFPGCALSCTVLLQAEQICKPPNQPQTNLLTYENCFCQSSALNALYTTPDSVCATECTIESDRTLLQSWFTTFCQSVGQGVDPLASTTVAPTSTGSVVVVTVTSTNTNPPSTTNTGTGSAARPASPSNQSWIEGHWRWILMLGILVIGLGLLAWLLIWLKRRHRRKVNERRATLSGMPTMSQKPAGARVATPDLLWGPHQHMHHSNGYEYNNDPRIMGSGALVAATGDERRHSRRHRERDSDQILPVNDRPPQSRDRSSKAKTRSVQSSAEAARSQSRSKRPKNPESGVDQVQDPDHQRRLREVRGSSRRPQGPDPT
jgi:hypothetical protein